MTTAIQWTDETWNPVVGCNQVSAGCDHCYAKTLHDMRHRAFVAGKKLAAQYAEPFEAVQLMPERLLQPLSWRRPRRVFVNSVSDLFHSDVPDAYLDRVFAVMAFCGRHTFQILTKRAGRMRTYLDGLADRGGNGRGFARLEAAGRDLGLGLSFGGVPLVRWPIPNIWLGVSVENHATRPRIATLRQTPAAVRFVSFEPLLEYMSANLDCIDWAVIGGESGAGARPFDLDWAAVLLLSCRAQRVAPFVKQLGARPVARNDWPAEDWPSTAAPFAESYEPHHQGEIAPLKLHDRHGGDMTEWPESLRVREFPASPG